ncbi:MAG: endo-1,4-beta-xylanase [Bacteroidaceae bacterium]|nr:endo-1,4-beta-xylanase [Bacteroidaceae bacterium]
MKQNHLFLFIIFSFSWMNLHAQTTMREAFKDKFLIGAAINVRQVKSKDPKIQKVIKEQFSALVPENCMKPEEIHPKQYLWDFSDADAIVKLAQKNKQAITGHCLVWHSQVPYWFFKDDMAQPVTKEELINRMRDHIHTVVGRYKGKIKGWDVVNEAILDNGEMRRTQFYNTIGPEYIRLAFQFAHEADPNAELYYNDYSMDNPAKRQTVVNIIRDLKSHGCRIDGVGMQSHVSFSTNLNEYEKSIETFAAEGVKVMVTELDLSVLPWPSGNYGAAVETNFEYQKSMNPYTDGLPADKAKEQTDFFVKLFKIYLKHADVIDRVTFWGLTDGDSWKNGWPMAGRTDYPLAIDRNYNPKPFVEEIIKLTK